MKANVETKFLNLDRIFDDRGPPLKIGKHVQFREAFSPNIAFENGRWKLRGA